MTRQNSYARNRVVLFGWPVKQSLSPELHGAAFEALDMDDWGYELVGVPPKDLTLVFDEARAEGLVGCNFTIPHKRAALELVDEVELDAAAIGAVNCAARDGARLVGSNTDVDGFIGSVMEAEIDLVDERVVVIGGGGAARAVVAGAIKCGARSIGVAVLKTEEGDAVCESLRRFASQVESFVSLEAIELRNRVEAADAIRGARLVVNATPVGMEEPEKSPIPADWLDEVGALFDCVYRADRAKTAFIVAGQERGIATLDGLQMLLHQGVAAFEKWTGRDAPVDVMRKVIAGG